MPAAAHEDVHEICVSGLGRVVLRFPNSTRSPQMPMGDVKTRSGLGQAEAERSCSFYQSSSMVGSFVRRRRWRKSYTQQTLFPTLHARSQASPACPGRSSRCTLAASSDRRSRSGSHMFASEINHAIHAGESMTARRETFRVSCDAEQSTRIQHTIHCRRPCAFEYPDGPGYHAVPRWERV